MFLLLQVAWLIKVRILLKHFRPCKATYWKLRASAFAGTCHDEHWKWNFISVVERWQNSVCICCEIWHFDSTMYRPHVASSDNGSVSLLVVKGIEIPQEGVAAVFFSKYASANTYWHEFFSMQRTASCSSFSDLYKHSSSDFYGPSLQWPFAVFQPVLSSKCCATHSFWCVSSTFGIHPEQVWSACVLGWWYCTCIGVYSPSAEQPVCCWNCKKI